MMGGVETKEGYDNSISRHQGQDAGKGASARSQGEVPRPGQGLTAWGLSTRSLSTLVRPLRQPKTEISLLQPVSRSIVVGQCRVAFVEE